MSHVYTSKIAGIDQKVRYSIQEVADRDNIKVVMFNWKFTNEKGERERKQVKRSILKSENIKSEFKLVPLAEEVIETFIKDQMKTHIVVADRYAKISGLYKIYLEQKTGISEDTKRPIEFFFKRFFDLVPSDNLDDLTPDTVKKAVKKIEELCHKKEMAWKYWANIHAYVFGKGSPKNPDGGFINWLIHTKKMLTGEEWVNLKIARPSKTLFKTMHEGNKKNPQYYWEAEEIVAIHAELSIIWKDYFWIMANTGMDLADLADLTEEHIIPDSNSPKKWKIYKKRKKEERFDVWIDIPLSSKVEKIILAAKNVPKDAKANQHRLLYPDLKAKLRNSHSQMYNRVRIAWRKAYPKRKMKNIKALRHTFITNHLDKGTPLHIVQDYVGHSRSSTVIRERYKGSIDTRQYIEAV